MPFRSPDLDHPLFGPFWRAAPAGTLNLPRCAACSSYLWPPAEVCPECLGSDIAWHAVGGDGTVWGVAEYHRAYTTALADVVPYRCVLVELDCGIRLIARLAAGGYAPVGAGTRVTIVRDEAPGQPDGVPCFATSPER